MSIVKLQSVTVVGLLEEKESALEALQELGCLHLRSLRPEEALGKQREGLSAETRQFTNLDKIQLRERTMTDLWPGEIRNSRLAPFKDVVPYGQSHPYNHSVAHSSW